MLILHFVYLDRNNANYILTQVRIPVVSNRVCNDNTHKQKITIRMTCAGFLVGGKDTCSGDSGGPLMYYVIRERKWIQTGITSFGEGCKDPGGLGVYTRVQYYPTWIRSKIRRP